MLIEDARKVIGEILVHQRSPHGPEIAVALVRTTGMVCDQGGVQLASHLGPEYILRRSGSFQHFGHGHRRIGDVIGIVACHLHRVKGRGILSRPNGSRITTS